MRALTGLDRVMVYRFHEDFHGEVVAESKREELSGWLGLHYPADDIPKPAREIFKRIWIRPLPDATAPVMRVGAAGQSRHGQAAEHDALLSARCVGDVYRVSAEHGRGGVAHHGDPPRWRALGIDRVPSLQAARVSHIRSAPACEFLAQVASLQLRGAEQRENLVYRLKLEGVHNQLIAKAAQEVGLAAMTEGTPNLLDGMDAGGAALYHAKRWWRMGRTPTEAQLDALKIWLVARPEFQPASRQTLRDGLACPRLP